jgi:uncharacterized protein (DUF2384 family)
MIKQTKTKKIPVAPSKDYKMEEPQAAYYPAKRLPAMVAEFTYKKFEKIIAKAPFTLHDWANILHLSERTLHRYSQASKSFEGIYVDRILQIEQLVDAGLATFTDAETFYRWLKRDKKALGQSLNFESLFSAQGINDLMDELGRIQYGVYI